MPYCSVILRISKINQAYYDSMARTLVCLGVTENACHTPDFSRAGNDPSICPHERRSSFAPWRP